MTNMITQNVPSLQDHIKGFKALHPRISYADIAKDSGVAKNTVMAIANGHGTPRRSTRLAIENALIRMAEREVAKKAFCDGASAAYHALIDDQIESAGSREKAELQKALADRVDQLTEARLSVVKKEDDLARSRDEIKRLTAMLNSANAQAQSSLAALTKAEKRIACQSENIDTLQQQLSAERVSYNDNIERLQSDIDLMQHEYTKAQTDLNERDTHITRVTKDKVELSHTRHRLKSSIEAYKVICAALIVLWFAAMAVVVALAQGV